MGVTDGCAKLRKAGNALQRTVAAELVGRGAAVHTLAICLAMSAQTCAHAAVCRPFLTMAVPSRLPPCTLPHPLISNSTASSVLINACTPSCHCRPCCACGPPPQLRPPSLFSFRVLMQAVYAINPVAGAPHRTRKAAVACTGTVLSAKRGRTSQHFPGHRAQAAPTTPPARRECPQIRYPAVAWRADALASLHASNLLHKRNATAIIAAVRTRGLLAARSLLTPSA